MQFKPLTEQEIRDNKFLPTGTYLFTVKSAKDNLPPGGTHTIDLLLIVNRGDGRTYPIKDSLSPANMGKLHSACLACGLADKYRMGQINAADFERKTGYARVFLNPSRNGYPEKNVISAYVAQGLMR
jgi:hypothetical protein